MQANGAHFSKFDAQIGGNCRMEYIQRQGEFAGQGAMVMIDDPFWSWALIVTAIIMMSVYIYIIVFSKSSKRMQKRLSELNSKNADNQSRRE